MKYDHGVRFTHTPTAVATVSFDVFDRMNGKRRTMTIGLVASVVMHFVMLLLGARSTPAASGMLDMKEVTFMDVTYRPEVAKILKGPVGGGGSEDVPAPTSPTYVPGVTDDVPSVDLSATLERDPSQAKIDLDRYDMDRGGEQLGVIRLGGSGGEKSTEEILSQPKVALSRGLGRGSAKGIPGLRGYPGVAQPQAQLTIEHRALAKPSAVALPQMSTRDLPKVEAPVSRGTNFMIAGPISQRAIIQKVVPRYPRWALDRRISGTAIVRIWVQPNGQVKGPPSIESSSGYPDLDQVVVDALRAWEFAPLGPNVKSEDQWGVVTFRFTLS